MALLQKKAEENGKEIDENLKTAFYGVFAVSPEDFEIVPGDKRFIKKIGIACQ